MKCGEKQLRSVQATPATKGKEGDTTWQKAVRETCLEIFLKVGRDEPGNSWSEVAEGQRLIHKGTLLAANRVQGMEGEAGALCAVGTISQLSLQLSPHLSVLLIFGPAPPVLANDHSRTRARMCLPPTEAERD